METNMLIKKIHMSCPLCDKTHEIEERKRITTITLKGEEVAYEERFYFCANADDENEFQTGAMTNENRLEKVMGYLKLTLQNFLDGEKRQYLDMKAKQFKTKLMIPCSA